MKKSLARQILAANLRTLYAAANDAYKTEAGKALPFKRWVEETLKLKDKAGEMLIKRAMTGENGGSVETLQKIADATGLQVWELLAPGMRAPIADLSPRAAELARLFDAIDKTRQQRFYTTARAALTGEIPELETPAGDPQLLEPDEPPTPTRARAR